MGEGDCTPRMPMGQHRLLVTEESICIHVSVVFAVHHTSMMCEISGVYVVCVCPCYMKCVGKIRLFQ